MINDTLPTDIHRLINTERALIFMQGTKMRQTACTWIFQKMIWWTVSVHTLPTTQWQVTSQHAIQLIAEKMNRHIPMMKLDAKSAFQTMSLKHIQTALVQHKASHLYRVWNLLYAKPWQIKIGSHFHPVHSLRAGCVAASFLFQLGLMQPLAKLAHAYPIAVMDDIYLQSTDPNILQQAASALAEVALEINPSKTAPLAQSNRILGTVISSTPIDHSCLLDAQTAAVVIRTSDVSLHTKWILTNHLFHSQRHLLANMCAPNTADIIVKHESLWKNALVTLSGLDLSASFLSTCFETGGLEIGFMPLIALWKQQAQVRATHLWTLHSLTPIPTIERTCLDTKDSTERERWWKEFPRTDGVPSGFLPTLRNNPFALDLLRRSTGIPLHDKDFLSVLYSRLARIPANTPSACGKQQIDWEHVVKCKLCSKPNRRHNMVVAAIQKACNKHGFHCNTKQNEQLPLPETLRAQTLTTDSDTQKGPDGTIYIDTQPVAFDVTIRTFEQGNLYRNILQSAFSFKTRTYLEWSTFYAAKCEPIVYSVMGNVHRQTRQTIENWAQTAADPNSQRQCSKTLPFPSPSP